MNYIYQEPLNVEKGVGAVLGSFSPLHKGHLSLIYKAKKENPGGTYVIVCGCEGDKGYPYMTLPKRYQMVREFFKDDPLVAVYCLSDDEMGIAGKTDEWDIWLDHFFSDVVLYNSGLKLNEVQKSLLKEKIKFYIGEKEYHDHITYRGYPCYLADRSLFPISATKIRSNPIKYWDYIAQTFQRVFSHNILITGTASEGKTTLVEDIGRYFNIPYSHEWARDYIEDHYIGDWEFSATDFLAFLNGQFNLNRSKIEGRENKGIFIADTDGIVTKMYAKYYAQDPAMKISMDDFENIVAPAADAYARKCKWDKIFVVLPRANFVDDHTRYMAHGTMEARNELSTILFEELEKAGLRDKIEILNGTYEENFNRVKEYIKSLKGE